MNTRDLLKVIAKKHDLHLCRPSPDMEPVTDAELEALPNPPTMREVAEFLTSLNCLELMSAEEMEGYLTEHFTAPERFGGS